MEPPAGTTDPPSSVRPTHRSARRWLVAVGVAYAAVQLTVFDLDRPPSWDEAVYLSQVAPGAEAYHLTAWRARGITLLVAPLATTGSIPVVRVGLALLAAVALVGAFLPWVRTIDTAAPVGAAFLASSWPSLFYGSEVMPNLWGGLAGVGALGLAVRPAGAEGPSRADLGATAILFIVALFRPFDAIVLAVVVVVAALVVGRRSVRTAGLLAAGAGAGCLVWLAEMAGRYGGVRAALDQAMVVTRLSVPDPWERVVQYLATADGPSTGPVADPGIPIAGLMISFFVAAAAGSAVLDARGGSRSHRPLMASLGGAAFFGAAYVAVIGIVAPRFLIPAAALLSVSVGRGVVVLWRRARRPPLRAALVVALLAWTAWQGWVAVRLESNAARQRAGVQDVGLLIGSLTEERRCVVASMVGAPQVGFASGCRGRPIMDVGTVDEVLAEEAVRGVPRIFLVVSRPLDRTPPGTSGRWSVEEPDTGPLTIYRVDR